MKFFPCASAIYLDEEEGAEIPTRHGALLLRAFDLFFAHRHGLIKCHYDAIFDFRHGFCPDRRTLVFATPCHLGASKQYQRRFHLEEYSTYLSFLSALKSARSRSSTVPRIFKRPVCAGFPSDFETLMMTHSWFFLCET